MPSHSTKIVIIGVGLIGPRHAQAVLQEPTAELLCIVDPNAAAQEVAHKLGTAWYASTKDMLAAGYRPDAAIVCTPNHTHVLVSKELLEAGIHVLVEKPISGDVESAQSLVIVQLLFLLSNANSYDRLNTQLITTLLSLWVIIAASIHTLWPRRTSFKLKTLAMS